MKEKILYAIWGGLYVICAVLGFVDGAQGVGKVLLMLTSLVFFVPAGILLYDAVRTRNQKTLLRLRVLAVCSLSLTLLLLIANIVCVTASAAVGQALHGFLVLVSVPMFCSQYWLVSLFLWACILMLTLRNIAKNKGG